nr:hypothetical protein [Tanacetum cinerariifolium]
MRPYGSTILSTRAGKLSISIESKMASTRNLSPVELEHSELLSQASVRDSFSCWEKARISPRSRSKSVGVNNRLMKAVRILSYVLIVLSLSSSSHVFASVRFQGIHECVYKDGFGFTIELASFYESHVVTFNGKFICFFRNGDCRIKSQSDNTVGSPHGFIIHEIDIFKGNEKVTELHGFYGVLWLRKRLGRFKTFQGKGIVCEMRGDGIVRCAGARGIRDVAWADNGWDVLWAEDCWADPAVEMEVGEWAAGEVAWAAGTEPRRLMGCSTVGVGEKIETSCVGISGSSKKKQDDATLNFLGVQDVDATYVD